MRIVHISDTHGSKYHTKLQIPECDVLIHSGDIGNRTNPIELAEFLIWFTVQPAKVRIFVPGNHDISLDPIYCNSDQGNPIVNLLLKQSHLACIDLLKNYNVVYLKDKEYIYEGVKFYGSPYSPSFHKDFWVFNADRGEQIRRVWGKIPSDVNVLITHTPPKGILDVVDEKYRKYEGEDMNVGCQDLVDVTKKRLTSLKLHCFGHIHDNVGCIYRSVSSTRKVLFSNGAVINNSGEQLVFKPLIITI